MAAVVVRNTFIEVLEEPTSPAMSSPPMKTAPGNLWQEAAPAEAAGEAKPGVFRRLFGARSKGVAAAQAAAKPEEAPTRAPAPPKKTVKFAAPPIEPLSARPIPAAPGTPVTMQEKNTFVHFDEARTPMEPPTRSAPGLAFFIDPARDQSPQWDEDDDTPPPPAPPVLTGGGSPSRLGARDLFFAQAAEESAPAVLPPPAPAAAVTARRCCASLGSEGHADGQCIPCLMQVRWTAGKCKDPCRFGEQCGRCHEPHTEEELHRVQAAMRRLKRRGGAAGAAALSAAYVRGTAAPVGAGAGKAAMVSQQPATAARISI